jgi:hypothetical protein
MRCFELAEPAQNTPHPGFLRRCDYNGKRDPLGLKSQVLWEFEW